MLKISTDSPPIPAGLEPRAAQVLGSFRHHQDLMGLDSWTIKLFWRPVGDHKIMATSAEPEYYQASIDIDLEDLDIEHLSEYVRHELLHVLLWQYTETAESLVLKKAKGTIRKLEERTVSDLERMPLWDRIPLGPPSD
jgi:hypothetical protein